MMARLMGSCLNDVEDLLRRVYIRGAGGCGALPRHHLPMVDKSLKALEPILEQFLRG